jgi:hypothetical protein
MASMLCPLQGLDTISILFGQAIIAVAEQRHEGVLQNHEVRNCEGNKKQRPAWKRQRVSSYT